MATTSYAVVGAILIALLAGCDGTSRESDPGEPPAAETPPGPAVVTCPEAPPTGTASIDRPDPELPAEVPAGATTVRLCAGGEEYTAVTAPDDALTSQVDAVVRAVNNQPAVDRPRSCRNLPGPTYRFAFGYPDGATFFASGSLSSCSGLVVGSGWRLDPYPSLKAFVRLLLQQRRTSEPPNLDVDPADLSCGQQRGFGWNFPLNRPTGLTTAILCVGQRNHPRRARRAAIPAADLAVIVESMRTDDFSTAGILGCSVFNNAKYWFVGENAWGDPIAVTQGCIALSVGTGDWSPRGKALRVVNRLIDKAR